jgi:hypothetical protein|eukprot:SAG31_NODE_43857_length_265_cov_0.626506_1_plen_53_part_00
MHVDDLYSRDSAYPQLLMRMVHDPLAHNTLAPGVQILEGTEKAGNDKYLHLR